MMGRAVLLAVLLAGAVAAAAAAGSPRKLLDDVVQEAMGKAQEKMDAATWSRPGVGNIENVAGKLPWQPVPVKHEVQDGSQQGSDPSEEQQVLQARKTVNLADDRTNPDTRKIVDAIQGPEIRTTGNDRTPIVPEFDIMMISGVVSQSRLQGASPVEVEQIPRLVTQLPTLSGAGRPDALAVAFGAARAGETIAATFAAVRVKDDVVNAVGLGVARANCQGGTNFALSISLATAANVAGNDFVTALNRNLARNFPASRCSRCITQTFDQANTFTQSLGGAGGVGAASSVAFALGVCVP